MKQRECDLQKIPGVGPRIAGYLESIGVRRVADLRDADPEDLYARLCEKHAQSFDRCLLYVLRCAVYYASTPQPQAHLLKWWNWQDAVRPKPRARGASCKGKLRSVYWINAR